MRVLLIEPHHVSEARGNATTARRWSEQLERRGVRVHLTAADRLAELAEPAAFDLIHAHHAVHGGVAAARLAREEDKPLVVSLGGTELAADDALDPRARSSLEAADVVVGPFPEDGDRLRRVLTPAPEYRTVRRGVALPPRCPGVRDRRLRGLVAGGLRPIKGQIVALAWQEQIRARGLPLELLFAGPVLDESYAAEFARRIAGRGQVSWAGVVSPKDMGRTWASCDLLVNASAREGASNAVLEAWAYGRPVVARAAPGNVELLRGAPGDVACTVVDDAAGVEHLVTWLRDFATCGEAGRRRRADRARAHVRLHHDPRDEADELLRAYGRARTLHARRPRQRA